MIPLTMPIEVYSGIAPPQKLLDSTRPPSMPPPRKALTAGKSATSLTVPTMGGAYPVSHSEKNTPMSSPVVPDFPKRPHSFSGEAQMMMPPAQVAVSRPHSSAGGEGAGGAGGGGGDELPPPTYEDALAEDIGPVDGPRRRYEQQGEYYGALPDDVR